MPKSRWARWTLRIFLALLAVPALALIALFIKNPEGAAIIVAILVSPLFTNSKPPPMFDADIAGMWTKWDEAGRKITAHLQQQFPTGTTEAALKSALANQGFKPLPPPRADCVPAGRQMPVGITYTPCPTRDPSKTLVYKWGGGVCTSTISVHWDANDDKVVTKLDGGYYAACL